MARIKKTRETGTMSLLEPPQPEVVVVVEKLVAPAPKIDKRVFPYGQCRGCKSAIKIAGLDRSFCPTCGWTGGVQR
jgi:hypothetical protein